MLALGFFGWIIIGGLAGWIAGKVMDDKKGFILNIVLGIVGGVLGGWLLKLLGFAACSLTRPRWRPPARSPSPWTCSSRR